MQQRASLTSTLANGASSAPPTANPQADPHVASSIPPWVHAAGFESTNLLPPATARPNTRHYKPPPPSHYRPGRKWDHLRSSEPPLLSAPIKDHQARWMGFMQSGPNYDGSVEEAGRLMSKEWMDEHMPELGRAWSESDEVDPLGQGEKATGWWLLSPERQERTVRLFWRLLLKNPFVPLVFRLTVLAFSASALGLAANIYVSVNYVNNDSDPDKRCATRASTYMAISVGAVAVPYIGYVTWDEFMSKPLGLRSVAAKTLLLLCDLYFIVFSASNLSLAFDALLDHRWACYDERFTSVGSHKLAVPASCSDNPGICYKQKALSGVLCVGLVAWLITFSISVMRVVERLRV